MAASLFLEQLDLYASLPIPIEEKVNTVSIRNRGAKFFHCTLPEMWPWHELAVPLTFHVM